MDHLKCKAVTQTAILPGVHKKRKMVHPERFERPTPRFVVWCSIQLSYGCNMRWELAATPGGCKAEKTKR